MHYCPRVDCDVSFDDHAHLVQHFWEEHGRALCPEPGCEADFRKIGYANDHFRTQHVGNPVTCTLCYRTFKQRGGFHNHKAKCVAAYQINSIADTPSSSVATTSLAMVQTEVAYEPLTLFQSNPVAQFQSMGVSFPQSQSVAGVQSNLVSSFQSAEQSNSLFSDDQTIADVPSSVLDVICEPDLDFLAAELGWNGAPSVSDLVDPSLADYVLDDTLFDDMPVTLAEPAALSPVPVQPVPSMCGNMVPRLSVLAYNMVKVLIDVAVIVVNAVEYGFNPGAGPSSVAHKREASLVMSDAKKRCLVAVDSSDCMFCFPLMMTFLCFD